ncbi:MAG: Slp family lipoprotein [Desulfobacteraceae bacterium]|nr:Slp family lipoprotein [Desulfobacteraceae bacterium]
MNQFKCTGILIFFALLTACSTMPKSDSDNFLKMPFKQIVAQANIYQGRSVVLGGYVLSVENKKNQTELIALQAPLGTGNKPKKKDLSQGRLVVIYPGFADPEVYTKGRKFTVKGKLLGSSTTELRKVHYPYIIVEVMDLRLWPVEKPVVYQQCCDPFWRPHPWWVHHSYYCR